MPQVIFIFENREIKIQCDIHNTMEEICKKFSIKMNKEIDKLVFIYNGEQIQQNILFEQQINSEDKKSNEMKILVKDDDFDKTIVEDKFAKSNEIICPKCYESTFLNIINFNFNISGCKNSHNFNPLTLYEFERSQNYNLSKIICNNCNQNNKGNTFNNKFYRCISCRKNLCPLCKLAHDKKHIIINYDNKNYICHQHNEKYIKYCNECNQNLCIKCDVNHKKHNIINFGELLLDEEEISGQMANLKKTIDTFNNNIKKIIERLNFVIKFMEDYYNISNGIFTNYKNQNRNYQILKNFNHILLYNDKLINVIKRINNDWNIYNKFNYIMEIYEQNNINKEYLNKINYKFNTNPNELKYKEDIIGSNDYFGFNDIFEIFISYKNNKEIIVSKNFNNFDLDVISISNNQKIISSLKGHLNHIISVRYFINNKNHKEYLVSSDEDKIVIIWNITNNYEIEHKIKTKYLGDIYFLLVFPHNNNKNYLVTSSDYSNSKNIETSSTIIYSLDNEEIINYIDQTNDIEIVYLLSWYNINNQNYYIIQFSKDIIIINSLFNNELYSKLEYKNANRFTCGFIYNRNQENYLCSCSERGLIIIWDLFKKCSSKSINIKDSQLMYTIQWNDKYIIVADFKNKSFKIIDIEEEKVISEKKGYHKKQVKCIKKINHFAYGESLLSAGRDKIIKLWSIK